ncbi:class I SAM-dependent methyltransferase [Roseiarcaceae bacterium H3SJ34-1]|uniref:class I SAM-dependent methyltransferase n=1 Tax=Terripilifer ovatus TaxID=3032367 RepID=UPI003AB9B280|nr:class I SAM-dependent methyltransferase [Roseiarcaceae bacterium H3SJ34-1]
MAEVEFENVYGAPAQEIVGAYGAVVQFSPLFPGARSLEEAAAGSLNGLAILAPPGTVERRYTLALALRALRPGARLIALAPRDKGGARIIGDLEKLGCEAVETAKRHHRICITSGPGDEKAIAAAIEDGKPQWLDDLGLWSQPGVFSWNRIDPGSALLLDHLPELSGRGADLGCGIGVLARQVLAFPKVTHLTMIDIDRRAIDMAKRNIEDDRALFLWADARTVKDVSNLDFVVMNPPFHEGGLENQALGQTFVQRAAAILRKGGICWLTANRHLPYEVILKPLFKHGSMIAEADGYKIYQAQK